MSMLTCVVLCMCIFLHANVEGYKILTVFAGPSYSHYTLGAVLMNELGSRGHDVTFVHPLKANPDDKFKSIELTDFMDTIFAGFDFFEEQPSQIISSFWLHKFGEIIAEGILSHPNVKKLIESDEQYDVVIVEQFMNDAMKGFCSHFKAPCIVYNSMRSGWWTNIPMANPSNPSYVTDTFSPRNGVTNFWGRFTNTFLSALMQAQYHSLYIPSQNNLLQKYFPNPPHLTEIIYNISLVLLNSDVVSAQPVPLQPNMVEIGGYHVKPPKKLPAELQKYLDSCKNGVVYFSMGSNLKSKNLPDQQKTAILNALGKLKLDVLWKFETDLPGKPKNVRIDKWLPQQAVLAHPNVKLFITHGGLLSTIETIYFGVPVVGLPIYGDQDMNMAQAERKGYGIMQNFRTITEEKLAAVLNEVLNNPKYAENAKKYSKIMHDTPMKPLDKAVFWIEYVARHKGATHFRSAALDLCWFQYYLFDVFGLISLILIIPTILLVCFAKCICKKAKCCLFKKCCSGKKCDSNKQCCSDKKSKPKQQ